MFFFPYESFITLFLKSSFSIIFFSLVTVLSSILNPLFDITLLASLFDEKFYYQL